jgi:hypothetical protein
MLVNSCYGPYHAFPWWTYRWKCPLIKFRSSNNVRGKRDYGDYMQFWYIAFNFNRVVREYDVLVEVSTRDIFVLMFIKESRDGVRKRQVQDTE